MTFLLAVLTCPGREAVLADTLASIRASDWQDSPLVYSDPYQLPNPCRSQTFAARSLLDLAARRPWDYLLFVEDDVDVCRHLRHNLSRWPVLAGLRVGSLYGTGPEVEVPAWSLGGSQGVVIARAWLPMILERWNGWPDGWMQDLRMYRSVDVVPIHQPCLVQHRAAASTWGGPGHHSVTFDVEWRA